MLPLMVSPLGASEHLLPVNPSLTDPPLQAEGAVHVKAWYTVTYHWSCDQDTPCSPGVSEGNIHVFTMSNCCERCTATVQVFTG